MPVVASCSDNATHQGKNDTEENAIRPKGKGKGGKAGGPQLGTPGGGPVIDKSGDAVLQAMIKAEVPEFRQLVYSDAETGKELHYNLFTPKNMEVGRVYPLVLFMADASTPGTDVTRPLTQGYGGWYGLLTNGRLNIPVMWLCPSIRGLP